MEFIKTCLIKTATTNTTNQENLTLWIFFTLKYKRTKLQNTSKKKIIKKCDINNPICTTLNNFDNLHHNPCV